MTRTVWSVEVSYEDDNPSVYGPYTEAQAERIVKRLTDEVNESRDRYGRCLHPHGVRGAYAVPLARYDRFLSVGERKAVRASVRAANTPEEA